MIFMKKILAATTVVLALGSLLPAVAMADGPINLSLFNPIQIVKEDQAVTAFRFSLIYGVNTDLTGVDLSLVGINKGSVTGVQWAAVGIVDGDFTGWQAGLGSITRGKFTGFQEGAYTSVGSGSGVQFGILNTAEEFSGLQLGIVNITQAMTSGLQIGLINIINNKEKLKVFPIVNWKF
jgi:hypothetical protein